MARHIRKKPNANEAQLHHAMKEGMDDWSINLGDALNIPAANVRENVKATWELDSDGLPVRSACGDIALQRIFVKVPHLIQDVRMVRSKWCPACGAQMGGAEDG